MTIRPISGFISNITAVHLSPTFSPSWLSTFSQLSLRFLEVKQTSSMDTDACEAYFCQKAVTWNIARHQLTDGLRSSAPATSYGELHRSLELFCRSFIHRLIRLVECNTSLSIVVHPPVVKLIRWKILVNLLESVTKSQLPASVEA